MKKILLSILSVILIVSCIHDEEYYTKNPTGIPINIEGAISQISTKVNAEGFEDKDALGIYAVNYVNFNQDPGVLLDEGNQADHVKYIFDKSKWKWSPVKNIYYKDVNTNVDIYAYYPYSEPESVNKYNFEVAKDQNSPEINGKIGGYEASDFLWGKSENVIPTESAIRVKLQHRMSGIHLVLEQGSGFEAGDFELLRKDVLVTGTTRKASINLSNGQVTPIGKAQSTGIVMASQNDGTYRAIVVPQKIDSGTELFNITIEGMVYTYIQSSNYEFKQGKLNQFIIKVNRKQNSGEYELELSNIAISDWKEDINTYEDEARQYYCVNVIEPGTLGKLIKGNKKNPDKIKNLKVSGRITTSDFVFMRDSMAILEAVNLKETKTEKCTRAILEYGYLPNGDWGLLPEKEFDDIIPAYAFRNKTTLYHFVFPEVITTIGKYAFDHSSISGHLVLPNDVETIEGYAFSYSNISGITLPSILTKIEEWAFANCKSLSGNLILPETLISIGTDAFSGCSFSGHLSLPNSLEHLGNGAFNFAGNFTGDLRIPDKIDTIGGYSFYMSGFTGNLDLNNVVFVDEEAFTTCGFKGDLILPEGITKIGRNAFAGTLFSNIVFPTTIKEIGGTAFSYCMRLMELKFPEGLISIGYQAFKSCKTLTSVTFPSTLQTIQNQAFESCFYISNITSYSVEPPILQENVFNGVAKDNFTLNVPENAVTRYQADMKWGQFRRISAHYDFSINRSYSRALNDEISKTYILRAPANYSWSIENKPDWIEVKPSSGVGKTEIEVKFLKMEDSMVEKVDRELYNPDGSYLGRESYNGRLGEIIFLLNEKDYRCSMTVEQIDYEYGDGDVIEFNRATKGNGVNIVFLGDCYDAKDIANKSYIEDLKQGVEYLFAVEPYKSYREYFNVYGVFGISNDSGIGTLNSIKDAKFGSQYSLEGIAPDFTTCYEYAAKAIDNMDPSKTLIVLIENTTDYGGICYIWNDGSAIACCPKSADAYPYDFRGIVQHEAGGHGFGKLADEYIYHNRFYTSCDCICCNHSLENLLTIKSLGWYKNIDINNNINEVGWSHLIYNPKYSDKVDVYEGGLFHAKGIFRSEPTSCMNNNIPYYSAISRQAIVERIMDYAGEEFTIEKFYSKDNDEFGATKSASINVDNRTHRSTKHYNPIFVGVKPEFKR